MKKTFLLFALVICCWGSGAINAAGLDSLRIASDSAVAEGPLPIAKAYAPLFRWLHGASFAAYDSLPPRGQMAWSDYQQLTGLGFETANTVERKKLVTLGWQPGWRTNPDYSNYDFNALTHVAWFAYNVNPETGGYIENTSIGGWQSKQLQELAAAQDSTTQVMLTVASHDPNDNRLLLRNYLAQENLLQTLSQLLEEGGGQGIVINFENVPADYRGAFNTFLEKLITGLKGLKADYQVAVTLPAVDPANIYDIKRLQPYVDYFILMGYDYQSAYQDGPVAPLFGRPGEYSIERSVRDYTTLRGLERQKLILGLPYYGVVWSSTTSVPNSRSAIPRSTTRRTYQQILAQYGKYGPPSYDWERCSAYYVVPDADDIGLYEKVWFSDSLILAHKYDWVVTNGLAGVAIWTLGYDNGSRQLWELMASKQVTDTLIYFNLPYMDSKIFNLAESLQAYQELVIVAGLFIFVFLLIGLIGSLYDWRVREVFFANHSLRNLYIVAGFAFLLAIGFFILYVQEEPVTKGRLLIVLVIAGAIGGGFSLLINRWHFKRRREIP